MKKAKSKTREPANPAHESAPESIGSIKEWLFLVFAWAARVLILALVAFTPWFYGGVQWQALQWIVWVCAGIGLLTISAVFMSPRTVGHNPRCAFYILGLLVLGLLQIVSLPEWFANRQNSHGIVRDAIQIAQGEGAPVTNFILGQPLESTISICGTRTLAALGVLASAIIVVWASGKLFCTRRWAFVLAVVVTISGVCNATLGIFQRVTWNGWSLLEFPTKSFYSTFVSRSSAADYFAIAFGAALTLLGAAYKRRKKQRRKEYRITYPSASLGGRIRNRMEDIFIDLDTFSVVCVCVLIFLFTSSLVTYSRGGALSMVAAGLVTLSLTLGTKGNAGHGVTLVIGLVVTSIVLLTFFGLEDQLIKRFDELNRVAYEREDGRLTVWNYSLHAMGWYWFLGSGLCTYQFALLPFHVGPPAVWFQHAESIYFEIGVEFGVLGLACCLGAIIQFVRDLFRESVSRNENFLVAGAAFAFFAIFLHSFVDFSLILPGVFLPFAALAGAFDGTVRRDELRKRSGGDPASRDQRLRYSQDAVETPSDSVARNWRQLSVNLALVGLCFSAQLVGSNARDGYARAEKLEAVLESVEKSHATKVAEPTEVEQLQTQLGQLVSAFPHHQEVQQLAGRIELFLLRYRLLAELPWAASDTFANKWQLTQPYATLAFLNVESEDPQVKAFQSNVSASQSRTDSLQKCQSHFSQALAGCPMDYRAAWGLYLCGLGQLTDGEEKFVGTMLVYLNRNNPELLFKAGIAAITASDKGKPQRDLGIELLKIAIELDPNFAARGLAVMMGYLERDQIVAIFPEDVVLRAKAARTASQSEGAQELSAELTSSISQRLDSAVAQDLDGWMALHWAAQKVGNLPLSIRFLRRMLVAGGDNLEVRLQLAKALFDNGERQDAEKELASLEAKNPSMRERVAKLREDWRLSMDQNP